jgi:PAS domain S-box-containing protein
MAVTRGADHRFGSINVACRELTGYDADEVLGRTADELHLYTDNNPRDALERQVAEQGSIRNAQVRLMSKGGASVDCVVSAETISIHRTPCVLWAYLDVTERRRSEAELAEAIDEVMKDTSWLSRSILDKLATLRRGEPQAPTAELSPREREILNLICDDLDDASIAEHLDISRNTVRNHVARLYGKIGVNRRSGAVIWGRERGLGTRRD